MSSYPPPYPQTIFNSEAFIPDSTTGITLEEANAKYLARTDVAVSVAQTTSFSDNITIGNTLLDYIPAQGLQIKSTVNNEAVFIRVLDGTGVTKQRIECNTTHTNLYDQTRFTNSTTPSTDYSYIQQSAGTLSLTNQINGGLVGLSCKTSAGASVTPIFFSGSGIILTPSQVATGNNGLTINSAIFGRNDIGANTFNGTLSYLTHPIGWSIVAQRSLSTLVSNQTTDTITVGTPTTVFNNLSNGVWRITAFCNNSVSEGASSSIKLGYGAPTGATVLNGDIAQIYHTNVGTISAFGQSWPELLLRTTGNGVTSINVNITINFSLRPTVAVFITAIKLA